MFAAMNFEMNRTILMGACSLNQNPRKASHLRLSVDFCILRHTGTAYANRPGSLKSRNLSKQT